MPPIYLRHLFVSFSFWYRKPNIPFVFKFFLRSKRMGADWDCGNYTGNCCSKVKFFLTKNGNQRLEGRLRPPTKEDFNLGAAAVLEAPPTKLNK